MLIVTPLLLSALRTRFDVCSHEQFHWKGMAANAARADGLLAK
jgi:hypothetical protein